MVVDCGGGTVDITVHELDTSSGRLEEVHKAAGGPHGSCGEIYTDIVGRILVILVKHCCIYETKIARKR